MVSICSGSNNVVPWRSALGSAGVLDFVICQGAPWSWKVMEFRKTVFQAWKVMENSKGHAKSWKMTIMSWNFYYCIEQFCKSDMT